MKALRTLPSVPVDHYTCSVHSERPFALHYSQDRFVSVTGEDASRRSSVRYRERRAHTAAIEDIRKSHQHRRLLRSRGYHSSTQHQSSRGRDIRLRIPITGSVLRQRALAVPLLRTSFCVVFPRASSDVAITERFRRWRVFALVLHRIQR